MRRRNSRAAVVLAAIVTAASLAAGCAHFGAGSSEGILHEARSAYEARDFETAYWRAKQLETEHPDSPDSYQAFVIACGSLKLLHHRHRYAQPDSVWVTSEPEYLFGWLAKYLDSEAASEAANVLFVGLPFQVFRDFQAYARSHPELAPIVLRAEDDNGIIQNVTIDRLAAREP
jgi:hypothetical protein